MKCLLILCLGMLVFQQTTALFHDWFDSYDDEINPWCKRNIGLVAKIIQDKITVKQLETMDKRLLECLLEQNLLGYVIRDDKVLTGTQTGGNSPVGAVNVGTSTADLVNPVNIAGNAAQNVAQMLGMLRSDAPVIEQSKK